MPDKEQHCPYTPAPQKYRKDAQTPAQSKNNQKLPEKKANKIQWIVGRLLQYARAIDMTMIMELSTISKEQGNATE